jgi:8-oxo-dGTP diphosphatase
MDKLPLPTPEFRKFQFPAAAVDIILFTIRNNDLYVGLVRREDEPYKGRFALPGRFVRYDEKIEETASKVLEMKGGIERKSVHLEQLYTFGNNLNRDTRIRTISVVYYGLVRSEALDFQNSKFSWHSFYRLPELAFDHREIIESAVARLRESFVIERMIVHLMPDEFTLTELQRAYEIILGRNLDKRNFRRKIESDRCLLDTKRKRKAGIQRPAELYSFKKNF